MRVVFFGTPDFAVKALEGLVACRHQVVAVVTQTDKPKGRSGKPVFSPVKEVAIQHNLPVLQYSKIRTEGVEDLKSLNADIFVTCAYGQILSEEIINIPKHGIINIHASLLPKYRGAAPIQWSIINGDEYTGVTIMRTEIGVDTGDILLQKAIKIGENETAGELFDRLSVLGAELIIDALDVIESGKACYVAQNNDEATHVKMLSKEDGYIDWGKTPREIFNLVRGMNPWPCAYTKYCGKMIKIWACEPTDANTSAENGQILTSDLKNGITVACGGGVLKITDLQLEGAKRMSYRDFLLGRAFEVNGFFGK